MAIMEQVKSLLSANTMLPEEQRVDGYVVERIRRSEERLSEIAPAINERYEFVRGQQYAYVNSKNQLRFLPTKTTPQGGGKRPWKSMSVNNLLIDIVQHEVSAATQRIPSYEVAPTSEDPDKRSAAKTSEKVALYGYHAWDVQLAAVKAVNHAVVGQESFAWPFYDTSIGPMIRARDGQSAIGRGDVRVRVYGPQDVMWEPGVRFEDSPYHIVVQELPVQAVVNTPGFFGEMVVPDSEITSLKRRGWGKAHNTQLVRVYSYLEQPSKSYPLGRWLTIANGRQIAAPRKYPVPEGNALVPLSYIVDPDNDRDMGLVQHLLDPQRIFNDAWNKVVEWKNLAMNPQIFVAPGVLQGQKITSEPGVVYQLPDPKNNIMWRDVPDMPQELFQIIQETNGLIARLAAQNDIPQQVEAGKAIQTLIERDQARRQSFIAQVARWHSAVASRGLYLVQENYNEPRLLQIKGRWSADTIKDFRGSKLLNQVDVTVSPASIEPRTKAYIEQQIMAFADRGWITPEQAMAAIAGGYGGDLITSYELDVGRATRVIARLKAGPKALYGTPENPIPDRIETVPGPPDPVTGQPSQMQQPVPDFMPRRFDNIAVQRSVFEDWMKTEEYETLTPEVQHAADAIYQRMLSIQAEQMAEQQMAMEARAANKGMSNAARNSGSMPDQPGSGGGQFDTPNQPPAQSGPQAA